MLMQVNFQINLRRVVLMSQYSHTYLTIFRTTQATISFIKGTEQESAYPWTRHIAPLFSGPAILYCYNSNLNWSCPDLSSALQHVMPSSSVGSNILPSWYWPVDVVRENIWSVPCPSNYAVIGGFSAAVAKLSYRMHLVMSIQTVGSRRFGFADELVHILFGILYRSVP